MNDSKKDLPPTMPLILDKTLNGLWELYKDLPGNFFWKDKNSRYLWASKNALQIFHCNEENTIIGKTDYELWPNHAEPLIENDKKILNSDQILYFEEKFMLQNEIKGFIVMKSPLINSLGEISGVIGSFIPLDQISQNQSSANSCIENTSPLKNNHGQYINSIIEAVPGSIYWKNKKGVWIGCNEFTIQI